MVLGGTRRSTNLSRKLCQTNMRSLISPLCRHKKRCTQPVPPTVNVRMSDVTLASSSWFVSQSDSCLLARQTAVGLGPLRVLMADLLLQDREQSGKWVQPLRQNGRFVISGGTSPVGLSWQGPARTIPQVTWEVFARLILKGQLD